MWIHVQTLILVDSLSFLFLTFLIPVILIIRAGSGHIASANRTEETLKEGARGRGGQSPKSTLLMMGSHGSTPTHTVVEEEPEGLRRCYRNVGRDGLTMEDLVGHS